MGCFSTAYALTRGCFGWYLQMQVVSTCRSTLNRRAPCPSPLYLTGLIPRARIVIPHPQPSHQGDQHSAVLMQLPPHSFDNRPLESERTVVAGGHRLRLLPHGGRLSPRMPRSWGIIAWSLLVLDARTARLTSRREERTNPYPTGLTAR